VDEFAPVRPPPMATVACANRTRCMRALSGGVAHLLDILPAGRSTLRRDGRLLLRSGRVYLLLRGRLWVSGVLAPALPATGGGSDAPDRAAVLHTKGAPQCLPPESRHQWWWQWW
jgi:hypothetical protein